MLHLEKETVNSYLPKTILSQMLREMQANTLKEIETIFFHGSLKQIFKDNTERASKIITPKKYPRKLYTISYNKKNDITIESTTLEHNPKLEFYS
jgi:hypothetical protein